MRGRDKAATKISVFIKLLIQAEAAHCKAKIPPNPKPIAGRGDIALERFRRLDDPARASFSRSGFRRDTPTGVCKVTGKAPARETGLHHIHHAHRIIGDDFVVIVQKEDDLSPSGGDTTIPSGGRPRGAIIVHQPKSRVRGQTRKCFFRRGVMIRDDHDFTPSVTRPQC